MESGGPPPHSDGEMKVQRNRLGALAAVLVLVAGCGGEPGTDGRFELVVGSRGHTAGKFNRPRGITHHPGENVVFVVDWDGRIQKFTLDGAFRASWIMPKVEKGKPEDLCVGGNGNLLVADTHYSRVVEFSTDGTIVRMFGQYGRKPGEFIYPVGICRDDKNDVYVSEYGENDRIQKFSPEGEFLLEWGSFGTEPGQFQRPSGIAFAAGTGIFVADAVNHRVQLFSPDGELVRVIGKEGTGPGEFRYPYDVSVKGKTLYVLEYGNHRVQKMTFEGKPLGTVGRPGRGDGELASPWRCAAVADALYVSDTENNRVVKLAETF